MYNRRNLMSKKIFPKDARNSKQFKQIPKLVKPESVQRTKGITNNKITKKVARLLVAGILILIIISIVIIVTTLA